MNTLLIYPKTKEIEIEEIEVPYSILFVGSYIKKRHKIKLFDERMTSTKKILKFISQNKVDCIGISTMTGPQIKYAINLSKRIRQINPNIKIVWGGVHPTVCPESVIKKPYVDFVVYGEGEETFHELLDTLKNQGDFSRVKSLIYKKDGQIIKNPIREFMNLNKISLDWSLINIKKYIQKKEGMNYLSFITSRGCPYRCNYCWNLIVNKRKWRCWTVEKTKKELKKILKYDINYIYFMDDNPSINKQRFFEIVKFLDQKKVYWHCEVRVSFVNQENLKNMPGCTTLLFGAESGSQNMLDKINKDITVQEIFNSATSLKNNQIKANYSWMMGFPGETKKDLKETMKLMDKIHRILPEAAQRLRIYNPYPGSPLFNLAQKHGFKAPTKLEQWADFTREYCVLNYVKKPWHLKCISYVTYFYFSSGKRVNTKKIYKLPIYTLKTISKYRWKLKFFRFPLEFMFIEFIRRILSPNKNEPPRTKVRGI